MTFENAIKLKGKLRKETDKLISDMDKVCFNRVETDDESMKHLYKVEEAHLQEIIDLLEGAINQLEFFTGE